MIFTVLTANIRGSDNRDDRSDWKHRKDFLLQSLQTPLPFAPAHILALQEVTEEQRFFLSEALSEYVVVGRGLPFFVHKDYVLNPESPVSLRRSFLDRIFPCSPSLGFQSLSFSGTLSPRIGIVNTHLSCEDRETQGNRIRQVRRLNALHWKTPVQLLVGDFNCDERHAPIRQLKRAGWKDTFDTSDKLRRENAERGTYHGFRGDDFHPPNRWHFQKIDFIFTRGPVTVLDAGILRPREEIHRGVFASDHDFVWARLSL